jgi:solute carrier family 7 (L-type amino acid transporter), member 9/15
MTLLDSLVSHSRILRSIDDSQIVFLGIAEYTFFVITTAGLLLLRVKHPQLHRPYKAFIGIPLFFIVAGIFIIVRETSSSVIESLILFLIFISAFLCCIFKSCTGSRFSPGSPYERTAVDI